MSGIEKLFSGMRVSASGLTAERTRIDVIAENIANARTTRTPDGGPYRRKVVLFEPLLEKAADGSTRVGGIAQPEIISDVKTPFDRIMDPSHPDADEEGMVALPNVNTVMEMADMVSALRAYEANLTVQEGFMRMAERALELAR